eukprot:5041209-Amphidinium_carterae.1
MVRHASAHEWCYSKASSSFFSGVGSLLPNSLPHIIGSCATQCLPIRSATDLWHRIEGEAFRTATTISRQGQMLASSAN